MNDLILFDNVTYVREGKKVIDGLDGSVSGRRIGVIGRNGSGKTTLARLLCGLIRPTEGQVTIDGADVATDRPAALRKVGLIFQNPDHQIIFPTVEEELAFGLQQQGRTKEEARRAARAFLERHGRAGWAGRSTAALSQGQRHFLCLLSVLAMEPKLIVMDEPFAGLDLPTRQDLCGWLDRLEQSVVMITHEIELLQAFDLVIWLEEGRVQEQGLPAEVLPKYLAAMAGRKSDLC